MTEFTHLWLYFLMVFGVIVLPGMDMAFVLASALAGGRKAGAFAVAGMVAGGVCHTASGALGIGLLFKLVPGLVDAMLMVGALYIAWLGASLLRVKSDVANDGKAAPLLAARSSWATFRQAALTCLLNPKAYLFMFAIFPQFLRVDYGPIWMQAVALGVITSATQIAVYGSLAFAAGSAGGWRGKHPAASAWIARLAGGMLIVGAAVTVFGVIGTH
jgi:threonine/homoserine/homoserine lactone efflux protein